MERPNNPRIKDLMSTLNLIDVDGNKHLVNQSLEQTVKAKAGIQDIGAWTAKLEQLRRSICRIEDLRDPRKVLGTGFLVSRDLVLTNYHIVEKYIDVIDPQLNQVRDSNELRCRFDYSVERHGEMPGIAQPLAADRRWIIHYSKYSKFDTGDQAGLPQANELDFALLRLSDPIGGVPAPDGMKRGWVHVSTRTTQPEPADLIFIAYYPYPTVHDRRDASLKLTVTTVIDRNDNGTRVQYDANTKAGSPGSPCFDANLNLCSLYQGGDPDFSRFSQAIPVSKS